MDDNITWIIGRPFRSGFSINALETVGTIPGVNEELTRYMVTSEEDSATNCAQLIVEALAALGYERGCTIRTHDSEILHPDDESADILEWRRLRNIASKTNH